MDQPGITLATPLENTNWLSVVRKTTAWCTSRLNRRRYQATGTTCCTGETVVPPSLFSRRGGEWLVEEEGGWASWLKASVVEDEPDQPPSAGWKFFNWDTGDYDSDESLICTEFLNAPPCHLTIHLGGRAKELHGECEGEYEPTKMISMGRTVMISFCDQYSPLLP